MIQEYTTLVLQLRNISNYYYYYYYYYYYSSHNSLCSLLYCCFLNYFVRIFDEMRSANNKYKTRVRSRVSNLGDLKNPGLKQRVLSGEISIERISTMNTDVSLCIVSIR